MNAILKAMHSTDIDVSAEAHRAFCARAKQAGKDPQALYAEMMAASADVRKSAKRSAVSFENVLLGPKSVVKRAPDVDADDDEMEDSAKERRGISAAARGEDGDDAEPDSDPGDEDEKTRRRTVAGTTAKHHISRGVSFTNIVTPDSRAFPPEEQESARQPRGTDTGEDALGREYSDAVMDRIAGGFSRTTGAESGYIPAGAGETYEGIAGDVNSGFRPMPGGEGDAGRAGGEDGHGTNPARPNVGRDGAYSLEAEGLEPGAGVVRVGPNFVLPGKSGGEGLSAPFIAPEPSHKVLKREDGPVKSEDRKGLFRSVLNEDSMKPYDGRG